MAEDQKKLTVILADNGCTYAVTAIYMNDSESWSVILKVNGIYRYNVNVPDFPASIALQMIADAQVLEAAEVNEAA